MTSELKGITWDHPRGNAPLVATAEQYTRDHPEVRISWEKRSLQAFGDAPLDELAANYDLLVIDHPHVGTAARLGCLVPLDQHIDRNLLDDLQQHSVGASQASYRWAQHQWALGIDAAAQVIAGRADRIDEPPRSWDDLEALARAGRLLWPLKPVDALMSFYSLAANRGTPCATDAEQFIDRSDALVVLEQLISFADRVPAQCLNMNPIQVLDTLSDDHAYDCSGLLFGYTNYARPGFRKHLLRFTDIPADRSGRPSGSILGGTGLAISSRYRNLRAALEYIEWVAGARCQQGLYFAAGGQPAHIAAWEDRDNDARVNGFFSGTIETLKQGYVRPRYDGYPDFQIEAGWIIHQALSGDLAPERAVDELLNAYDHSRQGSVSI